VSGSRAASSPPRRLIDRLGGRPVIGDVSGAVGDLGVLVPLVAALVVVNGLDPAAVLLTAGAAVLLSGVRFGVPWPVQPLKAMAAIAVAQQLPAELLHAGGLLLGATLLALTLTGGTERLARWFTRPVIRALQFGVGALLVRTAVGLAAAPPALFADVHVPAGGLWLAGATAVVVAVASARRWDATAVVVLLAGVVATVVATGVPVLGPVGPVGLSIGVPDPALLPTAFVVLVLPQLPLTFGNAVVGVSDLAHERFGARAHRITPATVARSAGVANVAASLVGGLPLCHGSSGFSAHVRLGARTAWMNVGLGAALLALGLAVPRQLLALLGLLPVWALAGFLVYAGCRHALLITDLRGRALVHAGLAGIAGVVTGELLVTTVVALTLAHVPVRALRTEPVPSGSLEPATP
jgi:SulP family sulfate permease